MAGAEFEIVSQSERSITVRQNRPWAWVFGEEEELWGVTLEEFDSLWSIWVTGICEHLGLHSDHWLEDGWWHFTVHLGS